MLNSEYLLFLVMGLLSFSGTWIFAKYGILRLRRLHIGQSIREDGPSTHFKKKGTPTMGGIFFIIPSSILLLVYNPSATYPMVLALLGFGLLGFIDDLLNIRKKTNEGLTPAAKFLGQLLLALIIAAVIPSKTFFLFRSVWFIEIAWLKYILDVVVLLSISNAVNLSDGLDGLASSISIPPFLALGLISFTMGNFLVFLGSFIIIMSLLAFLCFNYYPAQVFMGDTGSLALGGLMGVMAMILGLELSLLFLGFVFVLETLSVILQVVYFKYTQGKRLFLMSPLHHHFELKGWSENSVVRLFTTLSMMGALLGTVLYFC